MTGQTTPVRADPPAAVDGFGRVLVAGVGNVFLGDDGFGSEVARELARSALPAGVVVTDYGIRGMHLAYDLLDGWDRLVLIDLLPDRGRPGSVHVVEVDLASISDHAADPHGMAPQAMLSAVASMGGELPPTVLVGCEANDVGERLGLSAVVRAAVGPAVAAVLALLLQPVETTDKGAQDQQPDHPQAEHVAAGNQSTKG